MKRGVLYVMDTVVDGLVKIGKTTTDNFTKRMYNLEHNGYYNVVGLKRRFAIEVDDYETKETLLHTIFERSQVGNSELFSLDIEIVVQLLSSFEGDVIYPKKKTKDEVFEQAVEESRREAEEEDHDQSVKTKKQLTPIQAKRIDYWKRFYTYADRDKEMKELFGAVSNRGGNVHDNAVFSLGLGSNCRLDVIHRWTNENLIVQIWCLTNKYYPQIYDHKDEIIRATSHLDGSIVWDNKEEDKQSRHANVTRKCTGNDAEDFAWAVAWLKALCPVLKTILSS